MSIDNMPVVYTICLVTTDTSHKATKETGIFIRLTADEKATITDMARRWSLGNGDLRVNVSAYMVAVAINPVQAVIAIAHADPKAFSTKPAKARASKGGKRNGRSRGQTQAA